MAIYPGPPDDLPAPRPHPCPRGGLGRFIAAGEPDAFPDAGPVWQPEKLYYMLWSKKRMLALAEKFMELGWNSPGVRSA